jgi:hypothetical protein
MKIWLMEELYKNYQTVPKVLTAKMETVRFVETFYNTQHSRWPSAVRTGLEESYVSVHSDHNDHRMLKMESINSNILMMT